MPSALPTNSSHEGILNLAQPSGAKSQALLPVIISVVVVAFTVCLFFGLCWAWSVFLVMSKAESEGATAPEWPIASAPNPSTLLMGLIGGGVVAGVGFDNDVTPWPEELFEGVDLPASAQALSQPPGSAYTEMPPSPPADAIESVAWPDELFH